MPSLPPPFPWNYRPQKVRLANASAIVEWPPNEIVAFFGEHPEVARDLLNESYDKRYTPSKFIEEVNGGYRVGWYSGGYKCLQTFPTLAEAATDYLLFSLGKGNWQSSAAE